MNIGQRISVKRAGGGQSYGTITGTAKSLFDDGRIFLIAIDGLEGEYAAHQESLTEVRTRSKNANNTKKSKKKQPKNLTK